MAKSGNTAGPSVKPTNGTEPPRYSGKTRAEPAERAEWSQVNPNLIRSAVDACAALGDAIILARTRDGGAFSVVVLSGSHRFRYYSSTVEECEADLASIIQDADKVTFR